MDLADKFLGNLALLDPETSIPAQEILVSLRALHDELLSTHEDNARLRNELAAARKRLDHFDQVLAPKYQQHAQVSRENEIRLKQLLESERSQRSELVLEIQSLKVRLQTALGEINALKTQLSIKEDEAKQLELSLQTVQAQCDANARARGPETINNAVNSAVGGVKQEYEARLRTLDAALASGKKEYETQIAVLSQQLVLARKRESDLDASLNEWRSKYEQLSAASAADRAAHEGTEATSRAQRAELDAVQANNRRLAAEVQAAQARQVQLEAGLKQAASLAAARERERGAHKEKALQDYILHLNHIISVLEDTIARRLRDPKFRASPTVQGSASNLKRPQSARASSTATSSGLSRGQPSARAHACSHGHSHGHGSHGTKSKSLQCLADLRGFTGCCHDVKHSGYTLVGPSGEESRPRSRHAMDQQSDPSQFMRRQQSRSRSPSRSALDSFNSYAGVDLNRGGDNSFGKKPSGVQWADPVVQPWLPSSGVTSISSRPQHDSALVLPPTSMHAAEPSTFNPSDLSSFLPPGSGRPSDASVPVSTTSTAGQRSSRDPSYAELTLPAPGSQEERLHFADPVRSLLIRDLETELAQLTAQYTQAVSHFFGSQGRSVSRSMFESRNDDEAVAAVLNVPAFKKLAKEIAKRRQAIYQLVKEGTMPTNDANDTNNTNDTNEEPQARETESPKEEPLDKK